MADSAHSDNADFQFDCGRCCFQYRRFNNDDCNRKTRDIGILKSVGMNNRQVKRIFLYEGLFIGVVGTLAGFGLSILLGYLQNRFNLISIPADVYFMSSLPVLLELRNFLIIGLIAIASALLATLYPSYKAVKLTPSEATRYE